MSSSASDNYRITLFTFLGKIIKIIPVLPNVIRGLKLIKLKDHTLPLGLGLVLEKAVERNPKGVAVYYKDQQINYQDFNAWANKIADFYTKQGIKKGDSVIVFIENRTELLIVVAALAKIGAVSAMVNTSQTGKVLEHSVNLVNPKAAIVGQELIGAFNDSFDNFGLKHDDCYFVGENAVNQTADTPANYGNLFELARDCSSENPASSKNIFLKDPLFYIYTSGTTGMPKAVVFNHGRFMRGVGTFGYVCMRQTPEDVMYVPLPFYHSTAMVVCWGGVLGGAAAVAIRDKFSASEFWDDCIKYGATGFGYVGELCRYLLNQQPSPKDREHKVYKMVGNGLRPSVWNEFKERFGIKRVHEFYASSEGNAAFANLFNMDMTVGFSPLKFSLVKYDEETGMPVRNEQGFAENVVDGEPGLLLGKITDESPYDGYTDPEKTKKTILDDVFEKGDSWFNSGDVMRHIGFNHAQFVDRLGDTFRWKGENVSTTEVESVIHEYEQIEDSVVYGVEIPNTNGRAGMAILFLKGEESEFNFDAFHAHMKDQVPSYAVPLFLRVRKGSADTTGTFKFKKADLKKEAFYIDRCEGESIYVLLPGKTQYQKADQAMIDAIDAGQYGF